MFSVFLDTKGLRYQLDQTCGRYTKTDRLIILTGDHLDVDRVLSPSLAPVLRKQVRATESPSKDSITVMVLWLGLRPGASEDGLTFSGSCSIPPEKQQSKKQKSREPGASGLMSRLYLYWSACYLDTGVSLMMLTLLRQPTDLGEIGSDSRS
jgi:hypothetical protein